ncbi:MAG: cation:proton antiporter [Tissierellia bacterium]|nr:cation:proton antiporter [Tissierellia bacterium]
MHNVLKTLPIHTQIIISIGIIILSGFTMTRVTKRFHLPIVTGYILAGILIGPDVLHLIPREISSNFSFLSDVALSFIAFDVGRFLKRDIIKSSGPAVIFLTLAEALTAGIFVFVPSYFIFHLDFRFALLLGAIATATAPASTMMTIREYEAKGPFIDTLLQVVALDDVVCLLVFSTVIASIKSGEGSLGVILPILYNILVIAIGYIMGHLLSFVLSPSRSEDNRLIITIAFLLLLTGLCQIVDVSPLLSCMVFGSAYRNRGRSSRLFQQVNTFTPPIMALFFIVSGMNLSLRTLLSMKTIGIAYVLLRIIGKCVGSYFGAKAWKFHDNTAKYMGLALAPQAGVALGLAFMGQRLLGGDLGDVFLNIILASSVIYEIIGPAMAKYAILHGATSKRR